MGTYPKRWLNFSAFAWSKWAGGACDLQCDFICRHLYSKFRYLTNFDQVSSPVPGLCYVREPGLDQKHGFAPSRSLQLVSWARAAEAQSHFPSCSPALSNEVSPFGANLTLDAKPEVPEHTVSQLIRLRKEGTTQGLVTRANVEDCGSWSNTTNWWLVPGKPLGVK